MPREKDLRVPCYDNKGYVLFFQMIHQMIGLLAVSEIDVDQSDIGRLLGNQTPGIALCCDRPQDIGAAGLQKPLQSVTDVPGIFNDENADTFEFQGAGFGRTNSTR